MRRAALALAAVGMAVGGCQGPEQVVMVTPIDRTCPSPAVSAVRVSLLGDFPPVQQSADDLSHTAAPLRLTQPGARSVSVEGLSAMGAQASLGWTGPLPDPASGGEVSLPVFYGPPDTLCPLWGLQLARALPQATWLGGNRVLVSGGIGLDGPTDTMEIFHTDQALHEPALPLAANTAVGHTVTVLSDGTLLVVGGVSPVPGLPATTAQGMARVYRATGEVVATHQLPGGLPRALHAAVRISATQIWIGGGCSSVDRLVPGQAPTCSPAAVLKNWILFDEQAGFLSVMGSLVQQRYGHQALLLGGSEILLVGGTTITGGKRAPALQAEIVAPGAPDSVGALIGRASTAVGLLPGGGVLWAGADGGTPYAGVLLPNLSSMGPAEAVAVAAPVVPRTGAALTVLPDGAALLSGGQDRMGMTAGVLELFEGRQFRSLSGTAPYPVALGHAALPLPDGTVLLLGGLGTSGPTDAVSRFVHSLRLADVTPPDWPVDAADAPRWIAPRRPDKTRVDFDTGQVLTLTAVGSPGQQQPDEWALVSGMSWAGGSLTVQGRLKDESSTGLALLLGYRSSTAYYFVRLQPGQNVVLQQVSGQLVVVVPGCQGLGLGAGALGDLTPLELELHGGQLTVLVKGVQVLQCAAQVERGAVGLGSLGGAAEYQGLAVVRGQ